MSDELKNLRAALQAGTPKADPSNRAANLQLAQENFDRLQESKAEARPTSESHSIGGWLMTGVTAMINALTTRGGLVASTAIVAIGFLVVVPQGRDLMSPPMLIPIPAQTELDKPSTVAVAPTRLREEEQIAASGGRALNNQLAGKTDALEKRLGVAQDAPAEALAEFEATDADSVAAVSGLIAPAPMRADEQLIGIEPNTEVFANDQQNPLKITALDPVSTFSVDVDTASYGIVRSSLNAGGLPPANAVRIEEMINYFPYSYAAPEGDGAPFKPTVSLMPTPWNADTQLLHVALQGKLPALEDRPPLNLVFLIDTSGSMQDANKLPLLKQSFRLMLGQLRPEDEVAIVTYAGSAGQVLAATPARDRATIFAALDNLEAGGSTAGQAGLQQAYAVAKNMGRDNEITRVILATDGDFNVGISDPEALKDFIGTKRDEGTYLSVLGFGRGNLDDATMQALAQNGNGQAAYIDTLNEAQKVLVDQLTGALFPIANDVKIQMEFNPAMVAEYRLIGYETRALNREDFNNDKVDAGEIGAGHSVTALYEITPVGSPAIMNAPLRYGTGAAVTGIAGELGFLRLRYKAPGDSESQLIETPISTDISPANSEAEFAAAIAGFGQLLRGSDYLKDWGYGEAIDLATIARGADEFGYRAEAISLMRLAQSLSQN